MKKSRLLPLIGIAIFIYLLANLNLPAVAGALLHMNLLFFSIAILITAIDVLIKSFKWKLIFSSYRISVPFSRFLSSWIIGLSLSLITPGKVGDFAKAYYLKDKAPLGKSLTTVMADRIIDLLTLFILAVIGLTLFATLYAPSTPLLVTTYILFAAFIAAIIIFSKRRISSALGRPLFNRFAPDGQKEKIRSVYGDFYGGIGLILGRKKILILVIALTFIVWLGSILSIYFMALAVGFTIPYSFLLIVFPVITLLEALPISFSGLGTRDATLIFFFGYISVSPELAVSMSLLYLVVTYIFGGLGFALWSKNPIKLEKATATKREIEGQQQK